MIDINKYKGHSEGHKNGSWDLYEMYGSNDKLQLEIRPLHDKWGITIPITSVGVKDAKLIADAPMLLEEVKRLRRDMEGLQKIWNYLDPKGYAWEEEEFVVLIKEHGFETGDD